MINDSLDTRVRAMTHQRPSPENAGKYRALAFGQYACIGLAMVGAIAAEHYVHSQKPQYGKAMLSALAGLSFASQSQYFNLEKQSLLVQKPKRRTITS